jgi:hypothetical protein
MPKEIFDDSAFLTQPHKGEDVLLSKHDDVGENLTKRPILVANS